MTANPKINIAITGALSEPRAVVAELINSTSNGNFVKEINLETHYLVCEKHDSNKAKKAAKYGTAVIGESELRAMLAAGVIPEIALPSYTPHHPNNFPTISWQEVYESPRSYRMTYVDAGGRISIRSIVATGSGNDGPHDYLGGYDGPTFKTFRVDRIMELESFD